MTKREIILSWLFISLILAGQACSLGAPDDSSQGADGGDGPLWSRTGKSKVEADYGLAVIREGTFQAASRTKPWSAYWYPPQDQRMFFRGTDGDKAPLQKYDEWVKKIHHQDSDATGTQAASYDPDSTKFEGLCTAWAMAAALEPEPSRTKSVDGISFSVGDLKALLIQTYENLNGVRTYGKSADESEEACSGICPDQFHRVIQAELFEKDHAIVMDKDPSTATWTFPVYGATFSITRDAHEGHIMHVEAHIATAGPFSAQRAGAVGTLEVPFRYTYDLYGIPRPDGSLEARAGLWTGDSVQYHPDFLAIPPADKRGRHSDNPQIKTDLVDEIAAKARS